LELYPALLYIGLEEKVCEDGSMHKKPNQLISKLYDGHNAIVMGGTSGIGRATAELLAERGAKVTIVGRREKQGEQVAAKCRTFGSEAVFARADLTDPDQIQQAILAAQTLGPLTMAVNCAGLDLPAPIAELSEQDYDAIFAINVKAMWNCLRAELEIMKKGSGGSIVNVGSIAAMVHVYNNAAYCASKAAVASFTSSAAFEYGSFGIRVNCVAPGTTRTELLDEWLSKTGQSDDNSVEADLERATVLGYLSEPREQATAIAFLLSDEASYITGTTLVVDGGLTLLTRMPAGS
jgi:NAD(P)-dependent dehydrogenase (short-subunit alcohol dehydrogenase family)